jgi:hypothetical protein
MKQIKVFVIAVLLSSISNNMLAGQITPCVPKTSIDYSVAPDSDGIGCHQNRQWQSLESWIDSDSDSDITSITEANGSVNAGQHNWWRKYSLNDAPAGDVQWRTSSDNGVTWSVYGNNDEITQGDTVEFKFFVNRPPTDTR